MFTITLKKIDCSEQTSALVNPTAGALVSFEGKVRNHNEGHPVLKLYYEAFVEMAQMEGEKILLETKNRFSIVEVQAIHAIGDLEIGEVAVWIGVLSKHRKEGFEACRYVIDELKSRLPIWKKEYYHNRLPSWVDCRECATHPTIQWTEKEYYSRQTRLSNFGEEGQQKLKESSILVVGAGGLGSPALTYLVAAGVGSITICDPDSLSITNLHRQTLYSYQDIGKPKAILAKQRLLTLNPFVEIEALAIQVTPKNILSLLEKKDLILDCADNFSTRFLLHDACYLQKKQLIQASVYQYEGQIQTFNPQQQQGCLRCLWSEIPEEECVSTCAEGGILGGVTGVIGSLQAWEAIQSLTGQKEESDYNQTKLIDLMSLQCTTIQRNKTINCPLCGEQPRIRTIQAQSYQQKTEEWELSPLEVSNIQYSELTWVDLRSEQEKEITPLPQESLFLPLQQENYTEYQRLSKDQNYLLICAKGSRSKNLVKKLQEEGRNHFYSLQGGIEEFLRSRELLL